MALWLFWVLTCSFGSRKFCGGGAGGSKKMAGVFQRSLFILNLAQSWHRIKRNSQQGIALLYLQNNTNQHTRSSKA